MFLTFWDEYYEFFIILLGIIIGMIIAYIIFFRPNNARNAHKKIKNDTIEDEALRAQCEARGLDLGRQLVVNRSRMGDIAQVNDLARQIAKGASI